VVVGAQVVLPLLPTKRQRLLLLLEQNVLVGAKMALLLLPTELRRLLLTGRSRGGRQPPHWWQWRLLPPWTGCWNACVRAYLGPWRRWRSMGAS
jgi:hypothetical protein